METNPSQRFQLSDTDKSKLTALEQIAAKVGVEFLRAKEEWLNGEMKKLLPPGLYGLVTKYGLTVTAQKWLRDNDIEIAEDTAKCALLRRGKIIAAFEFRVDASSPKDN